jgi:hypothetical protein
MHWISDADSISSQLRLFEHIITAYNPNDAKELSHIINPNSLILVNNAKVNKNAVLCILQLLLLLLLFSFKAWKESLIRKSRIFLS